MPKRSLSVKERDGRKLEHSLLNSFSMKLHHAENRTTRTLMGLSKIYQNFFTRIY